MIVGKLLLADGAYDSMIFLYIYWQTMDEPCIKVRKNVDRVGLKICHILRNLSVLLQRNDFKKWKDSIVAMDTDGL